MVNVNQAKGTLQNLQKLEVLAHQICDSEGQRLKDQHEIKQMKSTIEELIVKREKLRRQLKNGPSKVLHNVLKTGTPRKLKGQRDTVLRALRSARRRKQEEFSALYRLTGVSVVPVASKRVRLCFDTFYNAQYYEPYYVELDFKDRGTTVIHRHTLPYFIPLQELMHEKMNKNKREFLSELSDYLNAYVARREQAASAQENYEALLEGNLLSLNAFNYTEFTLSASKTLPHPVLVKLIYDDLLRILPTRVSLTVQGDSQDKMKTQLKKLQGLLKSVPLPDVLATL